MTGEEIFEYNKKCAEFLGAYKVDMKNGLDYYQHDFFTREVWSTQCQGYVEKDIICSIYLQFHSDWNWVMKIVEAIEDIIFDEDNSFNVTIGSTNYCVIQDSNGEVFNTIQDYGNRKIDTVVLAINQFLIWYEKSNGTVVQ